MKFDHPLITRIGGYAVYSALRTWMNTLDLRVQYCDPRTDPSHPENHTSGIYISWHEYIMPPCYLRGHCNMLLLLSQHRDADWLSNAAQYMGFDTVRGSSTRGGTAALKELFRRSKKMQLVITPDGPRGPRRKLAQGAIFLSSKLQLPIIPIGFGFDRPWRIKTWDQFAVPRPFSHGRVIMGPQVQIPPNLDRDGIEHHRQHTESLLNYLTEYAENWAASRLPAIQDMPCTPRARPLRSTENIRQRDAYWQTVDKKCRENAASEKLEIVSPESRAA
ncbi:MAG: hypothetical protein COA78_11045 [Blastopirellula sp.]|nr:MAG: hypothetical protein COA78_11045 [Blastopirellula sp.]